MEKHGFTVTRHYAGLETAWRAEFTVGSGGRVLGVNSEMDALPGIGHACGHNLIGICGLGTAVAVKEALVAHDIAGKVILLGTPAEEDGGGKLILIDRDAYQEMDVCVMAHPGPGPPNFVSNGTMSAAGFIYAEYRGKPAHAAGSPWEGINALDAAVTAYSAISSLRQQMKPDLRVHGIIEGNDWAPNIIPDNAKLTYIVRAPSKDELEALIERLEGCFKCVSFDFFTFPVLRQISGAAMTAGCTVDIKVIPPYLDLRQNSVLCMFLKGIFITSASSLTSYAVREFGANVSGRYDMTIINLNSPASTDFGNVSYGE
ncbi:hypothetical protein C0991_008621 [Blastosporella zonata]|nr:hypothetical protein C0991_008621 [Blastosporella zonata]